MRKETTSVCAMVKASGKRKVASRKRFDCCQGELIRKFVEQLDSPFFLFALSGNEPVQSSFQLNVAMATKFNARSIRSPPKPDRLQFYIHHTQSDV